MNNKPTKKQIEGIENKHSRSSSSSSSGSGRDIAINGGLIDPAVVADYSEILPNAADRLLSMTEKELRHNHWLEKIEVGCSSIHPILGLIFAVALAFSLLLGGILCILSGHDNAGIAIIVSSPLAGLAAKFIYGTKK